MSHMRNHYVRNKYDKQSKYINTFVNLYKNQNKQNIHKQLSFLRKSNKCMIESRDSVDMYENNKLMQTMYMHASVLTIKRLVGNTNINHKNRDGNTALHIAYSLNLDYLKCLLENGANVNILNSSLKTVLTYAIDRSNIPAINLILKFNPSIEIQTVLALKNKEIKQLLLKNIHMMGKKTEISKILIDEINDVELIESLMEHKEYFDLEVKNEAGQTPLMLACIKSDLWLIKLLLNNDADINATDNNGLTVDMCITDLSISNFLVQHCVDSFNFTKALQILEIKLLELEQFAREIDYDEIDCCICLSKADCKTMCGHYYCVRCYLQYYYIQNQSKKCAVCRQEITNSLHVSNHELKEIYEKNKNTKITKYEKPTQLDFGSWFSLRANTIGPSSLFSSFNATIDGYIYGTSGLVYSS